MFRNVRFIRYTGPWPDSENALHDALAKVRFLPCGPLTEATSGFEAPVETAEGRLCRSLAGADLVQLRSQSRLLPASAVNEAVEARLLEFRERTGELPGRREQRRLKLETRDKLMPQALLRSERTKAFFLRAENVLAVDAASPNKLEHFLEMLRAALGRFDAGAIEPERPFGALINRIFLGDPPPGIRMGRECRMQDPSDSKATVRFTDMDLGDANVRKHVRDGLKLTHLAIEFDGLLSGVLDENGGLGKLRLLGVEDQPAAEDEDPLARFDAELVLLSGTLRRLFGVLTA